MRRYNSGSVNQGVMAMKWYFTFPKAPGPKPHHQMQSGIISSTLAEMKSEEYYSTSRQGEKFSMKYRRFLGIYKRQSMKIF